MNKVAALLLGCLLLVAASGCRKDKPAETGQVEQERRELTSSSFTLSWKVIDAELEVVVSAPTEGWLAVGFDPERRMQGANYIIGYVKDGNVVVRDDYGTDPLAHRPDIELGGSEDVKPIDGSEVDGRTEITFRVPLAAGDEFDKSLEPGQTYKVLLAYGDGDDFSQIHSKTAVVQMKL